MKNNRSNSKNHFRKREPPKPSQQRADVYVNNKSNFKCNLEKIEKLWLAGENAIVVRALGAAIPRAINLCLQFQKNHHNVLDLDVSTSTVHLADDLEPLDDDQDYKVATRSNSSITIKIKRKEDLRANAESSH